MKWCIVLVLIGFASYCLCALTEEQIIQTAKLMRKSCKTKTKAEDDELDQMKSGHFEDVSKKAKCYLACILQMIRLAQPDGHLDYKNAKSRIPSLPEPRRQPTLHALETCKDEGSDLTDKCEVAYLAAICFYNDTPEYYLVP